MLSCWWQAAAAANFITALQAMVEMAPAASAISTEAAGDAARWNATLADLRDAFARRYWDSTTGASNPPPPLWTKLLRDVCFESEFRIEPRDALASQVRSVTAQQACRPSTR